MTLFVTVVVATVVLTAVDVAVLTDVVVAVLVTVAVVVAVLTDVVVAVLVTVAVDVTVEGGAALVVVEAPGAFGENCRETQVEMLLVIPLSAICVQPAGAGTPAGIACAPPMNAATAKSYVWPKENWAMSVDGEVTSGRASMMVHDLVALL